LLPNWSIMILVVIMEVGNGAVALGLIQSLILEFSILIHKLRDLILNVDILSIMWRNLRKFQSMSF
jgi:hypothetical protein